MQIKYMGSSDSRSLKKGEDFGGQLSKDAALDRDIVWSWDNNHVIDTDDYEGVSDAFWGLLIDYAPAEGGSKEFKDVSGLDRVPTNEAQQIWRGLKKTEPAAPTDDTPPHEQGAENESGTAETDETDPDAGSGVSEATDTAASTSTVGGSTSGRPGPGGSSKGRSKQT